MKSNLLKRFICSKGALVLPVVGVILLCWAGRSTAGDFKDALGRVISLKARPQRIVAMAPSLTEILYYLGLGDKVVGVTRFSSYPADAARKPNIGAYINLNVEKIISLNPDLAIGTMDGNKPKVVKLLEQAGIPVFIVNPREVDHVIDTIAALGELCGVGKRGKELAFQLRARVKRVFQKTMSLKKPLVFLQINVKPIMTVNRNTFHHDVLRLAGGENMARNQPVTYPRISLEEVIRRKPEVIVISSMKRGGKFEKVRKSWLKWSVIPAVKSGRVHLVSSDLLDRPSPRIVDGLEAMARIIHPELGWEPASAK
ncbi:MAG: cobalamin-binding protein [Deltaproteobacteria bacterium]|nr:cobalamin-binding protein [Deltaproteobacteria bacterium]